MTVSSHSGKRLLTLTKHRPPGKWQIDLDTGPNPPVGRRRGRLGGGGTAPMRGIKFATLRRYEYRSRSPSLIPPPSALACPASVSARRRRRRPLREKELPALWRARTGGND